jgi:hypothetical protein
MINSMKSNHTSKDFFEHVKYGTMLMYPVFEVFDENAVSFTANFVGTDST